MEQAQMEEQVRLEVVEETVREEEAPRRLEVVEEELLLEVEGVLPEAEEVEEALAEEEEAV